MSGMHFERMAAEYADARPPYPDGVYDALSSAGVVGPGARVLEVGAGAGLATRELVSRGCAVVAIEPGAELGALLQEAVPGVEVIGARLEDAVLPDGAFDSVAAATALHWVDLDIGLPALHATLRPGGWLGVWRWVFGDDRVLTPFRDRVRGIVEAREGQGAYVNRGNEPPTMNDLAAGGWFEPVDTQEWRVSLDLTTDQVARLFRTFSNWNATEVDAAASAVDDLGGVVTERYRTVLHLLRRAQ
jgi:SAM-dependent methyltransferase